MQNNSALPSFRGGTAAGLAEAGLPKGKAGGELPHSKARIHDVGWMAWVFGANPRRRILGHVDTMLHGTRTREQVRDVLISIAREGGCLEVDTFFQEFYTQWPDLVYFLGSLCDAAFANRIIISVDCNWHWETGGKFSKVRGQPNSIPTPTSGLTLI